MEATTRVEWAKEIFESEAEFLAAKAEGNAPGLVLKYDADGLPYLDEGECEGPFAGDEKE